jgi:hypothetical protein
MSSNSRRRGTRLAAGMLVVTAAAAPLALAANDLASVQVSPQRGQSADQARRDRYECHNWAVEETGTVPRRVDAAQEGAADRGERIDRVVTGAAAGGAIGGLVRASQDEDSSHGVLSGAAIGAAVGALIGRRAKQDEPDPGFDAYFRALSACLEGRGYAVTLAGEGPAL